MILVPVCGSVLDFIPTLIPGVLFAESGLIPTSSYTDTLGLAVWTANQNSKTWETLRAVFFIPFFLFCELGKRRSNQLYLRLYNFFIFYRFSSVRLPIYYFTNPQQIVIVFLQ